MNKLMTECVCRSTQPLASNASFETLLAWQWSGFSDGAALVVNGSDLVNLLNGVFWMVVGLDRGPRT